MDGAQSPSRTHSSSKEGHILLSLAQFLFGVLTVVGLLMCVGKWEYMAGQRTIIGVDEGALTLQQSQYPTYPHLNITLAWCVCVSVQGVGLHECVRAQRCLICDWHSHYNNQRALSFMRRVGMWLLPLSP